ncbi:DUF507 family protein [Candidatus Sumerlaeota bacterium]|nr:DUF507 family protein [Candidatus Sumerlaeota bacterium]
MRLSTDRIQFIAKQITETLLKERRIRYTGNKNRLAAEIEKIILDDMRQLAKIEREAENLVNNLQRDIPEGSAEWQAIYQQKKDELARRYGYEL